MDLFLLYLRWISEVKSLVVTTMCSISLFGYVALCIATICLQDPPVEQGRKSAFVIHCSMDKSYSRDND